MTGVQTCALPIWRLEDQRNERKRDERRRRFLDRIITFILGREKRMEMSFRYSEIPLRSYSNQTRLQVTSSVAVPLSRSLTTTPHSNQMRSLFYLASFLFSKRSSFDPSFSSILLTIIVLSPLSGRRPSSLFSHAYSIHGSSRFHSQCHFSSPTTSLVQRSQITCSNAPQNMFFFSLYDSTCTAPQLFNRYRSQTKTPRRIFLFSHS